MGDELFYVTDYDDRIVTLYESDFEEHICDGHPEMKNNCESIKYAVQKPEVVYESNKNKAIEVFFSRVPFSTYPRLYTKVVVEYDIEKKGIIKSSWFEKTITGVNEKGLKYVGSRR